MTSKPLPLKSALEDSELRLDVALRAARIGIWDWDLVSGEMTYTPRAKAIFGFAPDEPITLEAVRKTTHPDDHPWTSERARRALNPEIRDSEPYEYRVIRADNGEVRWVLAFGEPVFALQNGETRAIRYLGTVQDITDRKHQEEALRESETRLRLAIEAARLAVWEYDAGIDEIRASEDLNRLFGLPAGHRPTLEELRTHYAAGEREKIQLAGQAALASGQADFEVEFRAIRSDNGEERWLLLRAEVLFHADGSVDRVLGVLMDIDDRKRAAEQQALVVGELNHRVKNILTVVQSVVSQTFREGGADPASLRKCSERIQALARANDVLARGNWSRSAFGDIVREIVQPFSGETTGRFAISGPEVSIPAQHNVPVALALHELATNAVKYGALSDDEGIVRIEWDLRDDGGIDVLWSEEGGPPVAPPQRKGFGMRLLQSGLSTSFAGIDLDYRPDGLVCSIRIEV